MGTISVSGGGGGGGAVILRVNGLSGTSITATLGSKTVNGMIPKLGVLEMSLGKVGQWTVKTTSGSYSFTQQVKAFTYGITEIWALAKKAFYDCTTTEIQAIAKSGMASQYWAIGDYHKITMTDGEEIEVAIADFNHDVTPGGVTIPVTLVMKNCFKATRGINNSGTTVGGWTNSNFRTSTLPSILSNFPDEWQNIMTTAQKKTAQDSTSATIVASDDKAWLLSQIELTGANSQSYAGEGTLYPIFTDNASRIKRVNNVANNYWTRSPASGYNSDFCYVASDGTVTHGVAGSTMGVSLGFCIG